MSASPLTYTLRQIADHLGATLTGGDEDRPVLGVAGIESAGPDQITFVSNPKYAALARTTAAAAVLVEPEFPVLPDVPTLRIANPYLAFARAVEMFYQAPRYPAGVHPTAVVDRSARLEANCHVGAYVVIGPDVLIGQDAVLLPHVVIYPGVQIGDRFFAHAHAVVREHCRIGNGVTLQNGAVIGGDGFGFAKDGRAWSKIVQSGITVLADGVEVQSNSTVDRASIGETRVGAGTKIDNLVQVGHGSTVGEHTLLCAQVGLAGSTEVGDHVILAGQVGVAGHCRIGDGTVVTAQSGVPGDVPANTTMSGYPAMDNRQWLRAVAVFARLPELLREVRALHRRSESDGAGEKDGNSK